MTDDAAIPERPGPEGGFGSILGIFVRPRATFERLAERPRFWLPLLLLVVFQLAFAVGLFQSGVIRNDMVAQMEAKGTPPEQIEQMESFFGGPAGLVVTLLSSTIGYAFILIVSAGLLYFMGNLMLGAKLTFAHYLCATAYSGVVGLVDQGARLGIGIAKGTLDVRLGLGNLFGEEIRGPIRILDTLTDPLVLWATAISALGVSVFARRGFGFGILAVLPGFLVALLLSGFR